MAALPHPWGIYALIQAQLSGRTQCNHNADGLEAGLNRFLDQAGSNADMAITAITRDVASGARRSRRINQMHAEGRIPTSQNAHSERQFEARSDLARLHKIMPPQELSLLKAVALGHDYQQLAKRLEASAEALRARVSRNRRVARLILTA